MSDLAASPLLQTLGWTLVHSLWQGALLALLAALALRLARTHSAELRHAIASWTLALLLTLVVATFLWVDGGKDPVSAFGNVTIAPILTGSTRGSWLLQLRAVIIPWIPYLITGWLLGFSLKLIHLGRAMAWLYGPCLRSVQIPPAEWLVSFDALQKRMKPGRSVRLGMSSQVDSLLALGWLRPIVIVPASAFLALPPEALEAVLIHELEHVRRGDFLGNILQTFAEALLFYHPAVWWLSRRIRQEREHCCDDAAVRACGDPILYASALARLEELRAQPFLIPDLAPAASGGRLMLRIQRILRPRVPHDVINPLAILAPALLLVAALGTATLTAAGPSKAQPVATTPGTEGSPEVTEAPGQPVDMEFSKIFVKYRPPAPEYPAIAKIARIQGTVVVVLTIDAKGRVIEAKAESGPEQLHACAVDYAKGWTFRPAKINGKPVSARFKLTMPFKLR